MKTTRKQLFSRLANAMFNLDEDYKAKDYFHYTNRQLKNIVLVKEDLVEDLNSEFKEHRMNLEHMLYV